VLGDTGGTSGEKMTLTDRFAPPAGGFSGAFTRRALFASGIATLAAAALAGCGLLGAGERSDEEAVQRALQAAVEELPEYADGTVQYADGISSGRTISGVLRVNSASREQTERALTRIHEALIRAYVGQPHVQKAFVRLSAAPSDDAAASVESAEVAPPREGANTTTDDLMAQFGLE